MENSIIDLIIRIKNGYMAKKESISSPYSKYKETLLKKLVDLKFIKEYKVEGELKKVIQIILIYEKGVPALTDVQIISRPGRRFYVSYRNLKSIMSGFGHSVLSTPKGIITNREARQKKLGGELLFNIW
jgi:small subunit ribosomal protein S8